MQWATEYDLRTNTYRALDIVTNSTHLFRSQRSELTNLAAAGFCAGGALMGDGTWVNAGGNQAITLVFIPAPPSPFLTLFVAGLVASTVRSREEGRITPSTGRGSALPLSSTRST